MIERAHDLPITKQAAALTISRGSVYYLPRPVSAADLALMRQIDKLHLEFPFAGSRMLRGLLAVEGCKIGRCHVKTLMRRMGIEALYRRPCTTKPEPSLLQPAAAPLGSLISAGAPLIDAENLFREPGPPLWFRPFTLTDEPSVASWASNDISRPLLKNIGVR
jgi:HTH-like domain